MTAHLEAEDLKNVEYVLYPKGHAMYESLVPLAIFRLLAGALGVVAIGLNEYPDGILSATTLSIWSTYFLTAYFLESSFATFLLGFRSFLALHDRYRVNIHALATIIYMTFVFGFVTNLACLVATYGFRLYAGENLPLETSRSTFAFVVQHGVLLGCALIDLIFNRIRFTGPLAYVHATNGLAYIALFSVLFRAGKYIYPEITPENYSADYITLLVTAGFALYMFFYWVMFIATNPENWSEEWREKMVAPPGQVTYGVPSVTVELVESGRVTATSAPVKRVHATVPSRNGIGFL